MSKIAYSAVVLDDKSRNKLIKMFESLIPKDWEIIAHHMTINMGKIDSEYEKYLGFPIRLKVEDWAIDDRVLAVGVSGFGSKNAKPYIIIAVNRKEGGKPYMLNMLKNWKIVKKPLYLTGKITEVPFK